MTQFAKSNVNDFVQMDLYCTITEENLELLQHPRWSALR